MNLICVVFILLLSLCFSVQISQPYKIDGMTKVLYSLKVDTLIINY